MLSLFRAASRPYLAAFGLLVNLFCIGRLNNIKAEGSAARTDFMAMLVFTTNLVFIGFDHLSVQMILQEALSHETFCNVLLLLKTTTLNIETWLIIGIFVTILERMRTIILMGLITFSTLFNMVMESMVANHVLNEQNVLICVRSDGVLLLALHALVIDLLPLGLIVFSLSRITIIVMYMDGFESWLLLLSMTALAFLTILMHVPFWLLNTGLLGSSSFQQMLYTDTLSDLLVKVVSWMLVPLFIMRMQIWHAKLVKACQTERDFQMVVVELDDLEPPTFSRLDESTAGSEL